MAPYSAPDLDLAQIIADKVAIHSLGAIVELFDILDVESLAALQDYVPGISNVYQTPVVGLWEAGVLVEKASGARGRDLVVAFLSDRSSAEKTPAQFRRPAVIP